MRILMLTNMYPHAADPSYGTFVFDQARSLRDAGTEVDVLFINGRATRWNYLGALPRLWRQMLRRPYDLIHAHYVYTGLIARAQILLPIVQSFHAPGQLRRIRGGLCRALARTVDEVVVTSEAHRARLGWARAHVIPCGVDVARFHPIPRPEARARLGWPAERRTLLWVGDPRREKRIDRVRDTFERLRPRHPDLDLEIVSRRPHDHIPIVMNAADVLILTSEHEGSPVVIKEAMACNLPIVSTAVGDVPERVRGVDGCRISEPAPEILARHVSELLGSGRRSDGRRAIEPLSTAREADRILEIYRTVLERRHVRGGRSRTSAGAPAAFGP